MASTEALQHAVELIVVVVDADLSTRSAADREVRVENRCRPVRRELLVGSAARPLVVSLEVWSTSVYECQVTRVEMG